MLTDEFVRNFWSESWINSPNFIQPAKGHDQDYSILGFPQGSSAAEVGKLFFW